MTHIIRLLQGFDLRNPTRTLDLISPLGQDTRISLAEGGFAPGPGKLNTRFSGQNPRRNGQRRTGSNRDNAEVTLRYILSGSSQTDVDVLQRKIFSFFRDAGLFEEELQSEPVWMFILWGETGGLESLPVPVLGQFGRYVRILKGEVERWPADTWHTIVAGYIEGVEMQLTYEPFFYGLPERAWSAIGEVLYLPDGVFVGDDGDNNWLRKPLTTELTGDFIIEGWGKFASVAAIDQTILHYYVDADNQLLLTYDISSTEFVCVLTVDGSTLTGTIDYADPADELFHFWIGYIVSDGDLEFVINADNMTGQTSPTGALPAGGTLALGSTATGDGGGTRLTLDGWRIFIADVHPNVIETAGAIYNAELPAKQQYLVDVANNAWIGPPTYWLTTAGDDVLANISHGVLGGVGGDVDALVKWDIKPADLGDNDETTVMWLSRRAMTDIDAVAAAIPVLAASHTFGGAGEANFGDNLADETFRGHAQFLAYISVTGADIDVKPYLPFQTDFEVTTIEDTGGYLLYDLGEIFRNWPMFQAAGLPTQVGFNGVAAGASDFDASFFVILPDPMCRLEAVEDVDGASFTFTNADYKLVLTDDSAYGAEEEDPGIETQRKYFEKKGPGITAEPGKYNAVFIMNGAEGTELHDEEWVVVPYVTPRWLLPGGLVA